MSRIAQVFTKGRKALIAYVTVGYPSVEATLAVVPRLVKAGADIVELGIPFSDPLADGVTIQRASFEALRNGITPQVCIDVAARLRKQVEAPLLFMTYYNPVYHYGLEQFCDGAGEAGVDGLIIPDLPPEEGMELEGTAGKRGLDVVYLIAPTSTEQRIRLVAEHSSGFIYLVSVAGVTGARRELPEDLTVFIARVRQLTDKPLCVGFGIASPGQARQVANIADGVIVGSRLIQLMEEDPSLQNAEALVREMRQALA